MLDTGHTSQLLDSLNPEEPQHQPVNLWTFYDQMARRQEGCPISPWHITKNPLNTKSIRRRGLPAKQPQGLRHNRIKKNNQQIQSKATIQSDINHRSLKTIQDTFSGESSTLQPISPMSKSVWTCRHKNLSNNNTLNSQNKQKRMLTILLHRLEDIKIQQQRTTRMLITPNVPRRMHLQIGNQKIQVQNPNNTSMLFNRRNFKIQTRHIRAHTSQ